jgi:uncharacterized protein
MIKSMLMVAVAVIVLAQSFPVLAASFNCSKAATKVEKMICADNGLSELDDQLAVAYKGSLEAANDKDALKQDQREWLAKRNELTSVSDLTGFYQTRIEALHEMIESGGSGQQAQQPAAATDKNSQDTSQGAVQDKQESNKTEQNTQQEKLANENSKAANTDSNKSSIFSTIKTVSISIAALAVFVILIFIFGARKVIGSIILILASITESPAIRALGEKIKGIDSGGKSLLAMASCKGRDQHDSPCKNVSLKCPKCGAVGCDQWESARCTNEMFIKHKCSSCGGTVAPEKDWISVT